MPRSPTDQPLSVEVPVDALPIWLAAQYADDGDDFWNATMPSVLAAYNMAYDTYWQLTVKEHRALWSAAAPEQASLATTAVALLEDRDGS